MLVKFYYVEDKEFEDYFEKHKEFIENNLWTGVDTFKYQLKRRWENNLRIRLEIILPKPRNNWELIRGRTIGGEEDWSAIELFIMNYNSEEEVRQRLQEFFRDSMGYGAYSCVDEESEYKKEIGGELELIGIYSKLLGDFNKIVLNSENKLYFFRVNKIEWLKTPGRFIFKCYECNADVMDKVYSNNKGKAICYKCHIKRTSA